MKKRYIGAMLLVLGVLICLGAASANRLRFKEAGFSIDPLDSKPPAGGYHALTMFLPGSDGFAPNVGVQVQPYAGTIDEYAKLSVKQFAAAKLQLVKQTKAGKSTVVIEYAGTMQGRKLHWYARAISNGKKVYLVTATATEAQWAKVSARLKACVDSFALNGAAKVSPAVPGK